MNKVILIGRLTKDVELRYTQSGLAVGSFTLAVDRSFSKEKETDFIPVVVWRKQAENCAKYIGKGSLVAIDGRMQVRSYDSKEGQRRWITEVIADNVKFLSWRDDNNESNINNNTSVIGTEVEFTEDDLPF